MFEGKEKTVEFRKSCRNIQDLKNTGIYFVMSPKQYFDPRNCLYLAVYV